MTARTHRNHAKVQKPGTRRRYPVRRMQSDRKARTPVMDSSWWYLILGAVVLLSGIVVLVKIITPARQDDLPPQQQQKPAHRDKPDAPDGVS